jgi:hypothetical protein
MAHRGGHGPGYGHGPGGGGAAGGGVVPAGGRVSVFVNLFDVKRLPNMSYSQYHVRDPLSLSLS